MANTAWQPPNPNELMVADLVEKYEVRPVGKAFTRLYGDGKFDHMFAVLHKSLNEHFESINGRVSSTRHYWADPSRELIALIKEIEADLHALKRAGIDVELTDSYEGELERCRPWLSPSGGSTIPEDFEPIAIEAHSPILSIGSGTVRLPNVEESVQLKMRGTGSYANVYSYTDPNYDILIAVKRAKRGLSEKEMERFKLEFETLKRLSFPYIVEVYKYDESKSQYTMEYCSDTLRSYISKHNQKLSFGTRKRIALQFLYGLNYLHFQNVLHRDISLQNILIKTFDSSAVLVKLSDFGLAKDLSKELTNTQTEMKGTIRDPLLTTFKSYTALNDIHAIGWVLSYIFTGRESLATGEGGLGPIVERCSANSYTARYQSVTDVIADLEALEAPVTEATA